MQDRYDDTTVDTYPSTGGNSLSNLLSKRDSWGWGQAEVQHAAYMQTIFTNSSTVPRTTAVPYDQHFAFSCRDFCFAKLKT
jgi:hypothetical protein